MGLLSGKRGAVFGVANERSIAWACAKTCAAEGASLAFNYLNEPLRKRVESLAETLPGSPILPCDVSKDDEIDAFFDTLGAQWDSIDFLIHSVAFAQRDDLRGRFIDTSRGNFALALDISAYSLVALARRAAPLFKNGGSVIAMTYLGSQRVVPNYNVMGVAKAALEASARYLASELGPQGVRVNCISAGPIKSLSASAIPGLRLMMETTEAAAPLRRNVTTSDVGKTALYLVSDLSSGVSGEVLFVDSGYHAMGMTSLNQEDSST